MFALWLIFDQMIMEVEMMQNSRSHVKLTSYNIAVSVGFTNHTHDQRKPVQPAAEYSYNI